MASRTKVLVVLAAAVVPTPALAAPLFGSGGSLGWFLPMFRMQYPTALDYILLVAAPAIAVAAAYFFYRSSLPDAVMAMTRPASVKLRAAGLFLVVTSVVLMLAPHWPIGWLLLLAIVGAVMALFSGLSIVIAAILILVVVAIVVAKVMHFIP